MDNRYELLKSAMVRNIKEYNAKFISRRLNPEEGHKFLPYIVLVIDEFAVRSRQVTEKRGSVKLLSEIRQYQNS